LQQPCPGVATIKSTEETAGAKQSFLSNILRIRAPSQQPAREIESGIDMGQHKLLKAFPLFDA
jgi:hypothetical protein